MKNILAMIDNTHIAKRSHLGLYMSPVNQIMFSTGVELRG